jgi:hypothetical protein
VEEAAVETAAQETEAVGVKHGKKDVGDASQDQEYADSV